MPYPQMASGRPLCCNCGGMMRRSPKDDIPGFSESWSCNPCNIVTEHLLLKVNTIQEFEAILEQMQIPYHYESEEVLIAEIGQGFRIQLGQ